MLSIVFFCSSDLSLGFDCFIQPNFALSFFCSFSTLSKVILPPYISLKIAFGPLYSINFTEVIFESLNS